jgi:hypothetical protein
MGRKRNLKRERREHSRKAAGNGSDRGYQSTIVNGRHTVPEFWIAEGVLGRVTVEALLRSEGTIEFKYQPFMAMVEKFAFFHIAHHDFWFSAGVLNGNLVFQRCEFSLSVPLETVMRSGSFLLSWSLDRLLVSLGRMAQSKHAPQRALAIKPRPTPLHLLTLARKEALLPTTEYLNRDAFLARVHSGLSFVQDKIDEMPNLDIFWNLTYAGNTVVARTPKREKDILPAIQCLLSDYSITSGIQVIPEMTTAAGRVDFCFVGHIRGQGAHTVCAEFKCAHSDELFRGVEFQLPSYLESLRTMDGTYCILDFRGRDFDQPTLPTSELHRQLTIAAERGWSHSDHPIKLHHLYLGRPKQ